MDLDADRALPDLASDHALGDGRFQIVYCALKFPHFPLNEGTSDQGWRINQMFPVAAPRLITIRPAPTDRPNWPESVSVRRSSALWKW